VVDSSGQYLQTFPVNDDGSVIATGLGSAKSLQLPSTAGLPQPSSQIELGLTYQRVRPYCLSLRLTQPITLTVLTVMTVTHSTSQRRSRYMTL
jgi:hypothetical protein